MKKNSIFTLIILLLFVTGCSKNVESPVDNITNTEIDMESQNYDEMNEPEDRLEQIEIVSNSFNYNDGDIVITYPSLSGVKDTSHERKINEILKNEVLSYLQPIDEISDGQYYEIAYEIMVYNDKVLSVVYTGSGYSDGAAYPIDVFFSTNIDLVNEKKMKLDDLISDKEELLKAFKSVLNQENDDEITRVSYDYILQNYDDESILNGFNEADETYGLGRYIYSYLTADSIGISWEIPHVIGDHVEIEIPIEPISEDVCNVIKKAR